MWGVEIMFLDLCAKDKWGYINTIGGADDAS